MKNSVLIIAHNEEKYIEKCIKSLINQTKKPDEIVLIAHNCDDKTIDIVREFQEVDIKILNEGGGIVAARLFGLNYVSGENIFCIDGDSYAKNNWLEKMSEALYQYDLIGSIVKFRGNIFGRLYNFISLFKFSINEKPFYHIWGPSFAFHRQDLELVKKYLNESIKISQKLNLKRNPDDFILSLLMQKRSGKKLFVTNKTCVFQNQKESNSFGAIKRSLENSLGAKMIMKSCVSEEK